MHRNIARVPVLTGSSENGRALGIAGFVYRTVRGVTRVVGGGIDAGLALASPALVGVPDVPAREAILSALNGVLGDHLVRSNNPLAISMRLRHLGHALILSREALSAQLPNATGKIVVLVHGLCIIEMICSRKLRRRTTSRDHRENLYTGAHHSSMSLVVRVTCAQRNRRPYSVCTFFDR